jgi:hypothetical protein
MPVAPIEGNRRLWPETGGLNSRGPLQLNVVRRCGRHCASAGIRVHLELPQVCHLPVFVKKVKPIFSPGNPAQHLIGTTRLILQAICICRLKYHDNSISVGVFDRDAYPAFHDHERPHHRH